ncbi:MAG TPA: ComF family protein [Usitatibacter sp.]|jgi:ComF family protein|nr:ComF family protein [Usitatibacter sp.]
MWPAQDCALCGASSGDALFCRACEASLPAIGQACPRCALPLPEGQPACGRCLAKRNPAVDDSIAVFEYRFPVDRLVQRFKFAADLAIGKALGVRLAQRARAAARPDCLVVPPLSPRRLRARGFNQALLLAKVVARVLDVRCEPRAVRRVRETEAQHELDRRQRLANLRGAFACACRFDGAHIAIVDDVVTTGATIETLARVLKAAGAARVSAWAVARTPDPALG